jgi:hypothetical protein
LQYEVIVAILVSVARTDYEREVSRLPPSNYRSLTTGERRVFQNLKSLYGVVDWVIQKEFRISILIEITNPHRNGERRRHPADLGNADPMSAIKSPQVDTLWSPPGPIWVVS